MRRRRKRRPNKKTDLISPQVDFVYNPFGQRILKIEKPRISGSVVSAPNWKYTYYTYDANGQVMATYDVTMNGTGNGTATLDELNIYGASRLGTTTFRRKIYDGGTALPTTGYGLNGIWNNRLGEKHYELTNHLGNVNAVITDRKIPFSNGDYYVNITGTGYVSVPYFIPNIYIAGTTVETWVRSTNSTGTYPLIYHTSTSQGITLNVVNGKASMDGKQSLIAKSSGPSTTTITDGAWHHVAGVVEPVTGGWEWKIYVDGVLENSQVLPAGSFGFGGTLHFGRNSASNTYYQGDMKEVSYWSVPRTGAQIISDMNTTFTGLEPDLLGYWPLKDNLNPTEDVSPNARNATLNNSAAFVSEKRYNSVVVMRSDYYPFGMQMSGRHTNDDTYRYGYNGMEKDKELKGEGNSYTTEFRQYDPRVGRWLSLDPLRRKYPNVSPYVAFGNNPILFIDPNGLDLLPVRTRFDVPKITVNRESGWIPDQDEGRLPTTGVNIGDEIMIHYPKNSKGSYMETDLIGYSYTFKGKNQYEKIAKHPGSNKSLGLITVVGGSYEEFTAFMYNKGAVINSIAGPGGIGGVSNPNAGGYRSAGVTMGGTTPAETKASENFNTASDVVSGAMDASKGVQNYNGVPGSSNARAGLARGVGGVLTGIQTAQAMINLTEAINKWQVDPTSINEKQMKTALKESAFFVGDLIATYAITSGNPLFMVLGGAYMMGSYFYNMKEGPLAPTMTGAEYDVIKSQDNTRVGTGQGF